MGRGQAIPIPQSFEKFSFKKENDNVCELKGASRKRNCIGTSNAKKRDLYCVFLTMEMNERGYKIKGPLLKCITLLFQWGHTPI